MGRHFTRASTESITITTAAAFFQNWANGTIAAMVRTASDLGGGNYPVIIACENSGGTDDGFSFYVDGDLSQSLSVFLGTAGNISENASAAIQTANGWCCVAVTKVTGSTAPRFHIYKPTTNAWVHAAGGTALVDNTTFNTNLYIGRSQATVANRFDGDIAAVMVVGRVMTDSEIERLPSGRWDRWLSKQTDYLREFPSGRDQIQLGRANDMARQRDSALTGTSRTAATDPPGFKWSRLNRRR